MRYIGLCIFAGLMLVFYGCAKNAGPGDAVSVQPNNKLDTLVSLSATIGSYSFSTLQAYAYNIQTPIPDSGHYNILITANANRNDSATAISMTIENFSGPDTYRIQPPLVTATWYVNNQRHYATSGNIVVISDTAYALIGVFSFMADSISVTNGKFNVLIPY